MRHGPRENHGPSAPANGVPTSDRCSVAREVGEPSKVGRQMTAQAGAPTDDAHKWDGIDWDRARREVRRLQLRIAKAVKQGRWNRVKVLQHLLTRSFYAKLLAVKRVETRAPIESAHFRRSRISRPSSNRSPTTSTLTVEAGQSHQAPSLRPHRRPSLITPNGVDARPVHANRQALS
jgi:hypothetical protein